MLIEIMRSLRLTGLTIVGCVVAYTTIVLASAAVVAPEKRLGSLVYGADGAVIGSRLVAQAFSRPEYLWPRPSAVNYNAAAAAGSNLSPTNPKVGQRAAALIDQYALPAGVKLPVDLVTASGSGLDPHITLDAALIQVDRIAMSRHVDASKLRELLRENARTNAIDIDDREGLINVLEFNMLLDAQFTLTRS